MTPIIHQIWIGPEKMPIRERYFIRDVKLKNPSWNYILWTDSNLPVMPHNIKKVYDFFGEAKQYAYQADVLRIFLIKEYGGIYLDVDFEPLQCLDDFLKEETLFCSWNQFLVNGVFGAEKESDIFNYACEQINLDTQWYGLTWFTKIVKNFKKNIIPFEEFQNQYAKHHDLNSWVKLIK